jgi:hypothetical protein
MAILSVTPIGASGGQPRSGSVAREGGRSYTRHFRVLTDGQDVGPRTVMLAIPVSIGQSYHANGEGENGEMDLASFAASATANEEGDDGRSWVVTVEYSAYNAEIQAVNPLDSRPKISWTWSPFQKIARRDKDGNPILNSAFDYFVPGQEVDDSRPVLQITRNEANLIPSLIDAYQNTVNTAPWYGMAARKWLVKIGPASQQFNPEAPGSHYFWEVTYEFHLSREEKGWAFEIANTGVRELYTSGVDTSGIIKKKRHILDSSGEKVTEGQALNADGTKKAVGEELEYLTFNIYRETDFSGLGFDAFLAALAGGGG